MACACSRQQAFTNGLEHIGLSSFEGLSHYLHGNKELELSERSMTSPDEFMKGGNTETLLICQQSLPHTEAIF
ncbi:hypothetical protein Y1Q_0000915 [Alligator mississippiensis]|uniref:Uncharacterized protein n=1 Tax=Alligator mississippiensis TaxID=8496 RepID=A0A151NDW7_ALLMI|nr:hypothetical protein Y1Q_0000915 [Alligator mississippiensis]